MAEYKQVNLQIGTETQFEEKKSSLPVGTLVGITDPIHKSELDSDLQTTISDVANKLNKPSGTPTADSVVKISSTGTPTWYPVSEFVDIPNEQTINGNKIFFSLSISADGGRLYLRNGFIQDKNSNRVFLEYPNHVGVSVHTAFAPNAAPTEPSFIVNAADRTPTWQSAAPILQDYVDDALLGG